MKSKKGNMQIYVKIYIILHTLFHTHAMILYHITPGNLIDFLLCHSMGEHFYGDVIFSHDPSTGNWIEELPVNLGESIELFLGAGKFLRITKFHSPPYI